MTSFKTKTFDKEMIDIFKKYGAFNSSASLTEEQKKGYELLLYGRTLTPDDYKPITNEYREAQIEKIKQLLLS